VQALYRELSYLQNIIWRQAIASKFYDSILILRVYDCESSETIETNVKILILVIKKGIKLHLGGEICFMHMFSAIPAYKCMTILSTDGSQYP